jgi:hypothetical protein
MVSDPLTTALSHCEAAFGHYKFVAPCATISTLAEPRLTFPVPIIPVSMKRRALCAFVCSRGS